MRVVGFFDHGGLTVFQILSFDEKMQQKGVCFQSQWDWFEHPKVSVALTAGFPAVNATDTGQSEERRQVRKMSGPGYT